LEGQQEDPLVLAEVEAAVRERNLLRPRPEQERYEALALPRLERHEPLQHAFEIREEPRLALLDANQRRIAVRRDISDAAATARGDLALHVVRDVEHRQIRQRRRDRERNLDRRHFAATSRGRRKWTSSRATVISSRSE